MTGAKLSYRNFENSFDNIVNNSTLQKIMKENLEKVGIIDFIDGNDGPTGSTDIGNVSHVCPTMYTEIKLDINQYHMFMKKSFYSM